MQRCCRGGQGAGRVQDRKRIASPAFVLLSRSGAGLAMRLERVCKDLRNVLEKLLRAASKKTYFCWRKMWRVCEHLLLYSRPDGAVRRRDADDLAALRSARGRFACSSGKVGDKSGVDAIAFTRRWHLVRCALSLGPDTTE